MLIKTSIKKNLYYEIKDRILEEQFDGFKVIRRKEKRKVYGSTSDRNKRNTLIELLHQRVQHHRDKFKTRELYEELLTMVVKPNGKVEHADDAHDDLIFSYLWALYVFYYGEDLVNRFHLMKTEVFTDDNYDETSFALEEEYDGDDTIVLESDIFKSKDDPTGKMVDDQMKILGRSRSMSLEEFYAKEKQNDDRWINMIMNTKDGRKAISKAYNIPQSHLDKQASNSSFVDITTDMNNIFYSDNISKNNIYDPEYTGRSLDDVYQGNLSDIFKKI